MTRFLSILGGVVLATFCGARTCKAVKSETGQVTRYDPETGETTNIGTIDASDLEALQLVRSD